MSWQFAVATHIGDRDEQQDRVTILHSEDGATHLLIVADGMGGHEDGAKAAQMVIDTVTVAFDSQQAIEDPQLFLERVCLDAHVAIAALAADRSSAPGSTCVILYLTDTSAYWVHVGDSRLYQFNDGRFVYRTSDHSIAQLIEEQQTGSADVVPQNELYMCLGGNNEVTPESAASIVQADDFFLLCSDGIWSQLDVEEALSKNESAIPDQQFADQLVDLARQQGAGQSDNICLAWAYHQGSSKTKSLGFLQRLMAWF